MSLPSAVHTRTLDLSKPGTTFLEGPVDVADGALASVRLEPEGADTAVGAEVELLRGYGPAGASEVFQPLSTPKTYTIATGSGTETVPQTEEDIDVQDIARLDARVETAPTSGGGKAVLRVHITVHTP